MDIFNNYPKKIYISRVVYCVQHDFIKNKKEHIDKLKKYRNLFNFFCVDTKKTTTKMTKKFLDNISKNKNHLMYCIFYKKKLIGQYGIKYSGKKRIFLDNALRFSALGGKKIFSIIEKKLLNLAVKNNFGYFVLITVNKKNLSAVNMHKKFKFKDARLICDVKDIVSYIKAKSKTPTDFFIKGLKIMNTFK